MNNRMSNQPNFCDQALCKALRVMLVTILLPCLAYGQVTQSQAKLLETSIAGAKSGNFLAVDIDRIAGAGAAEQVLPALEEQFAHSTEVASQGRIASALVRLGDRNDTYLNFLLAQATLAIDSDLPDPFHDIQEIGATQQPSRELSAWAQAHHVDYGTAAQSALYELPGKVMLLGITRDPRGIPLLRRALLSRNPMIVMMAAKGLAEVKDNNSIPAIIDACRRAPKGFDAGIAEASLIYFDDPRAQSAVDTYVPRDRAKTFRDAKANGMGPFGPQTP